MQCRIRDADGPGLVQCRIRDADGPDPKEPEDADQPAAKKAKKAKPAAPVPRTRLHCRPGESEADRRARVRTDSRSRRERDKAQRAADQAKRRARQRAPEEPVPSWREPPPPRPADRDETPVERAKRVDGYFDRLDELAQSFRTCPNCMQRGCGHVNLGEGQYCKYCCGADGGLVEHGRQLQQRNGLELSVERDEEWQRVADVVDGKDVPRAFDDEREQWKGEWAALKARWGELSPLEEALVSPVLTMSAVLQLPSGQQLGYRGSVINFVSETGSVARQLPRAPCDANLIVYRVRGMAGTHKDLRVRRDALREHLAFFAEHHRFFREGIPDPQREGEYIVPRFRRELASEWLDEAALGSMPVDGTPDGLDVRDMEDEEAADEPPHTHESDDESDAGRGELGGDANEQPQQKDPTLRVKVRRRCNHKTAVRSCALPPTPCDLCQRFARRQTRSCCCGGSSTALGRWRRRCACGSPRPTRSMPRKPTT